MTTRNELRIQAPRTTEPDKFRLHWNWQRGIATLITKRASQKTAFLQHLHSGEPGRMVFRASRDGVTYWVVRTSLENARSALRRLGWTESTIALDKSQRNPAEPPPTPRDHSEKRSAGWQLSRSGRA